MGIENQNVSSSQVSLRDDAERVMRIGDDRIYRVTITKGYLRMNGVYLWILLRLKIVTHD